jgi:ABC-2 type transport system permease protein
MRAAPILIAAWIFFGMKAPASTLHFLVWLPSITLGFVLSASIVTLISVSLFWTISGEGIARLLPAAVWMLSGIVVPVPLLPTSIRAVLELLPTSAIVDTPFRIYTGQYGPADFLPRLLLQAFWTMAFLAFGKAALARGVRRLVIQGG